MKKRFIVIPSILLLSLLYFPGCTEWLKMGKSGEKAVVKSKNNSSVLTCSGLTNLIKIFEDNDPKLKMLIFAPVDDQIKAYYELVNRYVVTNYAVKKYIEEKGINKKESYQKEYKEYMEIMENQFNNGQLQKVINDEIIISDELAKNYYESNRDRFSIAPFTKVVPGSDIYIIPMEEGKSLKDYEAKLKAKKDGQLVEKVNASKGLPKEVFEAIDAIKTGEMSELFLGARFAVYKIAVHKGEWHPYEKVSEQVKNMIRIIEIEKKYVKIIDEMKSKYDITIDENCLREILEQRQKEQSDFSLETQAEEVAKAIENEEIIQKAEQAAKNVIEKEVNKEIEKK